MRKEAYKIKCPDHVVIGDPWYFEREEPERLQRLVVDIELPKTFEAALSIRETEYRECEICMAFGPISEVYTYLTGQFYEGQEEETVRIPVDTARYLFKVDGRSANIHTHEDGYWGQKTAFYGKQQGKRHLEGYMVIVNTPDDMTFEEVRQTMESLFGKMKLLPEKKKAEEKRTGGQKR